MARPVASNEGVAVVLELGGFTASNDNVKAHLWHLRRKLDRLGIAVETLRGVGYRLAERDKAQARRLVA
jgi:DNA-binding response OmpR family regulator